MHTTSGSPEGASDVTGADLLAEILALRKSSFSGRGKYREPVAPGPTRDWWLPQGWVWASVEQLSAGEPNSLAIGPFGSNLKVSDYRENGVPLIFVRNIRAEDFDLQLKFVTPCKADELLAHSANGGDILITKMGDPPGDVSLYPAGSPRAIITADCIKWRLSPALTCPKYFVYAIRSKAVQAQILQRTRGVAQKKVSLESFRNIAIPSPPLDQQRRIVDEIEKQFTQLDTAVAALRRVQANLKRYRASVLKAACEGRLSPTEADLARAEGRTYESGEALLARILTERRQNWRGRGKYKEPTTLGSSRHEVAALPEGWGVGTVEELNIANRPCAYGVLQPGNNIDGGIPFVRVGDINNGKVDLGQMKSIDPKIAAQYPRTRLYGGEFLITLVGAIGRTAVVPECLAGGNTARAVGVVPLTKLVNPHWVEIWFRNPSKIAEMTGMSHEVARKTLNLEDVRAAPVAVPPLAEQTRIVAEVERRLSVLDELDEVVSANLKRAVGLRQSVLRKAFVGELICRDLGAAEVGKDSHPAFRSQNPPNRHFARALLSAEIVHRLHQEPTFGRTKHQKIFHLCEHIAQIREIDGQYHREAAGPLDNKLIYANEAELKKQKWYEEVKRDSYGHAYHALPKAGNHRQYVESYWPDKLPVIERLIELMRSWKTERCEIFCTVYAAWNDLILAGGDPTEEAILHEILDCWNESKRRIPRERWVKAIEWMRKEGWEPHGFGKPTQRAK